MKYKYKTKGTCSTEITFDINNDVITNVKFTGGCNGNLQAVSKLVDGLKAEEIEAKLKRYTLWDEKYLLCRPTYYCNKRSPKQTKRMKLFILFYFFKH